MGLRSGITVRLLNYSMQFIVEFKATNGIKLGMYSKVNEYSTLLPNPASSILLT